MMLPASDSFSNVTYRYYFPTTNACLVLGPQVVDSNSVLSDFLLIFHTWASVFTITGYCSKIAVLQLPFTVSKVK